MDMPPGSVCDGEISAQQGATRPSARCDRKAMRSTLRSLPWFLAFAFFFFQNAESAGAGIVLPVTRSFSQVDGSGTEEGSSGMTAEHATKLRDHDYRRGEFLRRKLTSVVDFPLAGNDFDVGLYYTVIGLGTPSSDYYVQIDTGSDLLWVNCEPCSDCPSKSDLNIHLRLYDPESSSTSSNASCSSNICKTLISIADSSCADNSCLYSFGYGDRSTTTGYLVEDSIKYDAVTSNNSMQSASAKVAFGCGFNQTGESLTSTHRAVDGIMGLGRQVLSLISQLAAQDLTANQFAHCLQGDTGNGGIFVFGDVKEPGISYTSILSNEYHYNVALQSIDVNGQRLNIPTSVFDADTYPSSEQGGTIFDSGTTLAFFVEEAYSAFIDQLLKDVNISPTQNEDNPDAPCFEYSSSNLSPTFPSVTLNFDGASMQLEPSNYLYKQSDGFTTQWCVGWSSSGSSGLSGLSILGDLVLKNKLVVYDLENARIGWTDFNCMAPINVSNGVGSQVIQPVSDNAGLDLTVKVHQLIGLMIFAIVSLHVIYLI